MKSFKALLTIQSDDRVGLISLVTGHLFDRNINLGDTSFAISNKRGEFTSLLEIPSDLTEELLAKEIKSLDGLNNALVRIQRISQADKDTPPREITHHIHCEGKDQPGLLARLSEVFIDYDANIVALKSDRIQTNDGNIFVTHFSVNIPPARASSCLAALSNTAGELRQKLTAKVSDS
jgi:glycine cleavage system transcriptional repressor